MLFREFKKAVNNNREIDWVIDPGYIYPVVIQNANYIHLLCKKCGAKKQHNVGNIKHTLTINSNHCRCVKCTQKKSREKNSVQLIARLTAQINESDHFSWRLNTPKIGKRRFYTSKTPVPLVCKQCGTAKCHTTSNIITSLFVDKNHITCQVCKLRNSWKKKIEHISGGHFLLDTAKTALGFKIIHQQCGHYYYINSPHLFKKGVCPFCSDGNNTLKVLRDIEQYKIFISIRSEGRLQLNHIRKGQLTVSCNLHPEAGEYNISWDSFRVSNRNGKTYLCAVCRKQRLRNTYPNEYNERIAALGLEITIPGKKSKLSLSEKILHRCKIHAHHPPFYASPNQVEVKNKRCLYCSIRQSYHKDYQFIKNYIEMDKDRFSTHAGRQFRLLSSLEEIESQVSNNKRIADIKLRVNELTCPIHDEFEISWGSFCYNNMACSKCTRDNQMSYAHVYYQALLEYFHFDYIPEYVVRVGKNTVYRIDFKLSTLPHYLEIDSNLHTGKNGWSAVASANYQARDRRKNKLLAGNIERIRLYDSCCNVLPIKQQLDVIEDAFINRAEKNGIAIEKPKIEAAKADPLFFRNARIIYFIRRLQFYHGGHITFNDTGHLAILQATKADDATFYCNIHKESFRRSFKSVMKMHFLCPVCTKNILYAQQDSYFLDQHKMEEIKKQVRTRFRDEFIIDMAEWGAKVYSFHTVVFPVYSRSVGEDIYIPLYHLLILPAAQVKKRLKNGAYRTYTIDKKKRNNPTKKKKSCHDPVPITYINNKRRVLLHEKSEQLLRTYQLTARRINLIMKNRLDKSSIAKLIAANEKNYTRYIHLSNAKASRSLALYDRKILPYFRDSKTHQLLTPREKYSNHRQFLLIEDVTCGHVFYSTWTWIAYKLRKGLQIQCQHKDCYSIFYHLQNPGPRKIEQEHILTLFRTLFNGQYYPVHPECTIMVREPIEIIHLPSGDTLNASFDNFRRGKFRSPFKNLTIKEIKKIPLPVEKQTEIIHK